MTNKNLKRSLSVERSEFQVLVKCDDCLTSLPLYPQFHLRVYCVSRGDIKLYVYHRILALFSSERYTSLPPKEELDQETPEIDLQSHLTNTSLQTELGESNVRLLDELEGCHILSGAINEKLTSLDIQALLSEVAEVLSEVFKAALQNPVHFQVLVLLPIHQETPS